MKMPEKHDLLAAILAAKERASGQSLRLCDHLRGRYNGDGVYKNSNRRNGGAHYRLVRRDLLDLWTK